MSTTRKGDHAKRGQRYQNSWAYKPRLHSTEKQSSEGASSPQLTGLCPRCREIIEWKIKYGKYKALSAPKKCTVCGGREVRRAYHRVCGDCSRDRKVCGKCGKTTHDSRADDESGRSSQEAETPG